MKRLLVLPVVLGILAVNPLNLKASNFTVTDLQEDTKKTDNISINNSNSSENVDYYWALIPQPELIPERENNILKINLFR